LGSQILNRDFKGSELRGTKHSEYEGLWKRRCSNAWD